MLCPVDDYVIRAATLADAERLVRFLPPRPDTSVERRLEAMRHDLRERVRRGELLILLAEHDGAVVGYARASHVVRPAPRTPADIPPGWYLLGVYVAPEHRRRGVARAFTERRLSWIAEQATEAFYFTRTFNDASLALHVAYGFREVARGVNAPGQPVSADRVLLKAVVTSAQGS